MYTLMKKDWQKNIGFVVMDMIGLETILFITCEGVKISVSMGKNLL